MSLFVPALRTVARIFEYFEPVIPRVVSTRVWELCAVWNEKPCTAPAVWAQFDEIYMASAKSDASKKNGKESLKAIHDKYNAQVTTILTPEQAKVWKRIQKD